MIRPFIFSFCFLTTFAIVACTADQDLGGCADAGLKFDGDIGEAGGSDSRDGAVSDGGSEGGGDDGGDFSVKNLPGLAVWLDVDVGVVADPALPGSVKRWLDQSGNGNDANVLNQPEPTIDPSVVHGHNGIICSTGGLSISSSPSMQWGTGDFAIAMVLKAEASGNNGVFLWDEDDGADPAIFMQLNGTNDFAAQAGNATVAVANSTGNFQLLVLRGSAMRIVDQGGSATGGTNTLSLGGTTSNICQGSNSDPGYELAELITIKGALSDADLASMTAYLKAKYNLP